MKTKDYLVVFGITLLATAGSLYYRDKRIEKKIEQSVAELRSNFADTLHDLAKQEAEDQKKQSVYPLQPNDKNLPDVINARKKVLTEIEETKEQLSKTPRNDKEGSRALRQKIDELKLKYRLT